MFIMLSSRRLPALESLRGIAALIVVVHHAPWQNPLSVSLFFRNGGMMVDLFFVLSGFVLTRSYRHRLQSRGEIRDFVLLRLGRLYPLHLVFLLVFLSIECFRWAAQLGAVALSQPAFATNDMTALLENLLLLQGMGLNAALTYNFPSWSISVEFYTYLLFAACVYAFGTGTRLLLISGALVLATAAFLALRGHDNLAEVTSQGGFYRCCMGFFLGTIAEHAYRSLADDARGVALRILPFFGVSALAGLSIVLAWSPSGFHTYLVLPLSAIAVLSLAATPDSALCRLLGTRWLVWLGTVSYSVYLSHATCQWLLGQISLRLFRYPLATAAVGRQYIETPAAIGLLWLAVCVGMVLLVSRATHALVEVPGQDFVRSRIQTGRRNT
jgi:peptidoglycan/LPS O-acetylase OafA/YrhL